MRALLYSWAMLWVLVLCAQDFEDQFEQFKSQDEKDFEQTKQQQDSIFARSIIENWRSINLVEPLQKKSEPKPEQQPKLEPSLELEDLEHKFIDTQPKLMRSFNRPSLEYNQVYEPELEKQFSFFGEPVKVRYSSKLLLANDLNIDDQHDLAKAWQLLSKLPYQSVVKALFEKRDELQLPDYGYLMLLDNFLSILDLSESSREVYKWFLLIKSGYVARIGLINNSPVLVIGSYGKIYGKRYYSSTGINFYILSDQRGELESYIINSDVDNNPFDLSLIKEIKLPLEPVQREFRYESKTGKIISLKILYNKNVIDLLNGFPQADLTYYLSSSSSDLLSKSIKKSLRPFLEGRSTIDKINFLLEFVQNGFEYQSDTRHFGSEKVLYPEELFFYPFSDCDDRVVLLAYLLRMFVDVPMIALAFPQHVALGLKLTSPVFGESIKYNGFNFTFCDPTYFNAPIGTIIPSANRKLVKIIEF